ncbi:MULTISPECIES: LamG-like jellyroll fold domain-containing protein [Chryseobacterium]|uniref:LamG-like jellyroll fold domain-containing protein n=1 Tax=Chryseobacterium camelliae TaxID=1265445 RepID=A0ABU0TFU7_9FLAO|nr:MULTISPECIES: LamG-like jellyroll fold domain-containing protein [Chryseobacterium]MDT3407211.1 hypothetical protein [Pseudacidovorax intermedius]MDQ1094998.1 hypothetical protein [Chryseobacterium camelliae]MDQ1098938.1 hypothetical protein [Chryseobacterium sp. SORGH_AS_1048]MDR6086286.1 hypothetical protein [Chryseobacterium sp. SORGH_AS_0909]MDR6130658.1 hypothetical protein [Chryseobacterium sp. SORGH_AS_1175]
MKKIYLFAALAVSLCTTAQTPNYVPASGLVAWWGFNGNANDSSANGNNLMVNSATLTADRNGNPNSAYAFNGTTSYLSSNALSYTFSLSGAHSISFWMKKSGNTEGVALMSGSNTGGNFIWLFQCDTTKPIYGTNKQGQSWTWVNGPAYSTSQWEHYVAVYNNQTMQVYKNGVSVGTATNTYTNATQAAMPFYIGRAISGGYIAANIDDVGIWNRALSASEVNQLYTGVLSTKEVKTSAGSIAPNPAGDFISVSLPLKGTKTYVITDMNGRKISSGTLSDKKNIQVSELQRGTYIIEVEGTQPLKFIKK